MSHATTIEWQFTGSDQNSPVITGELLMAGGRIAGSTATFQVYSDEPNPGFIVELQANGLPNVPRLWMTIGTSTENELYTFNVSKGMAYRVRYTRPPGNVSGSHPRATVIG